MIENMELVRSNIRSSQQNFEIGSNTLVINLRKQVKELQQEMKQKSQELETIKKNIKVTKMQELETERKEYFDETLRLNRLLQKTQDSIVLYQKSLIEYKNIQQELLQYIHSFEKVQAQNITLQQQMTQNEEMSQQMKVLIKQFDFLQTLYNSTKMKQTQLITKQKQLQLKVQKLELENTKLRSEFSISAKSKNQSLISRSDNLKSCLSKDLSPTGKMQDKSQIQHWQSARSQIFYEDKSLSDQLRYRLLIRGINAAQLNQLFDSIRQQEIQEKSELSQDHLQSILLNEPFAMTNTEQILKILEIMGSKNILANFEAFIGQYTNYYEYPEFDFRKEESTIKQTLQKYFNEINEFFKNTPSKTKFNKQDLEAMVRVLKFGWSQLTTMLYYAKCFEKSGESFDNISLDVILNPFLDDDSKEQQSSFFRDIKRSPQADDMIFDQFDEQNQEKCEQILVHNYYPLDMDDFQVQQSIKIKQNQQPSSKYIINQQTFEIKEESEEQENADEGDQQSRTFNRAQIIDDQEDEEFKEPILSCSNLTNKNNTKLSQWSSKNFEESNEKLFES